MRYKVPIEIIQLELENYHLIVCCTYADGTKGNWVLDTGASKSVFDNNLVDHFSSNGDETEELHSAGVSDEPMTTSLGYLKMLSFGKLKVESMKVALMDMTHINELYSKVADLKICGLLGSDFLLKYKAVIDYKRKRLVFSK